MKNKPVLVIVAVSALIVFVSIAFAFKSASGRKTAEAEAARLREQIGRMQAYLPDEDVVAAFIDRGETNEIAVLKVLLAEKNEELAMLSTSNEPEPEEEERPERESWEDRMARMKEEDPDGYAEMVERRQQRQQEMRYTLAERTATFMDLDTSLMNEEELANHEKLVEIMANVWTLTDEFQDPEAAPDREVMQELYREMSEARPLLQQERVIMFKQLGAELGYQGEDANLFADHVEDIISATTLRSPRGGGRRGGRR
ncbi:MAG: hypothetical protein HKP10_02350 [Kiritimatiellales bacterium]|nr:hypothetical protein [Kiritimatiellales bacterium]